MTPLPVDWNKSELERSEAPSDEDPNPDFFYPTFRGGFVELPIRSGGSGLAVMPD
jgi:hypothetical protein